MLLIPDVHITSNIAHELISSIEKFVSEHDDEKDIVFVGDYVYHFAYDRKAISELYKLFIRLFQSGKTVYVLAGNHDWLVDQFVYLEGKQAFDMLNQHSDGKLYFIDKPSIHKIGGEYVFFLPFMIDKKFDIDLLNLDGFDDIGGLKEDSREDIDSGKTDEGMDANIFDKIQSQIDILSQSDHKNEKYSAYINDLLLKIVKKFGKLSIVHHYYTNAIKFPGHKAKFGFKDIAISEYFLDLPKLKLISGHIHSPFAYKNYVCVGNLRSTSSLENNTIKGFWRYNDGRFVFFINLINPYRQFNKDIKDLLSISNGQISMEHIEQLFQIVLKNYKEDYLSGSVFYLDLVESGLPLLEKMHIHLSTDDLDYSNLEKYFDQELLRRCKDLKLKQQNKDMADLMKEFSDSKDKVIHTFSDWKLVLKEYIKSKYPETHQKYYDILQDMKIL